MADKVKKSLDSAYIAEVIITKKKLEVLMINYKNCI